MYFSFRKCRKKGTSLFSARFVSFLLLMTWTSLLVANAIAADEVGTRDDRPQGYEDVPSPEAIKEELLPGIGSREDRPRTRGASLHPRRVDDGRREIDIEVPFDLNGYFISARAVPYLEALGKALSDESLREYVFEVEGHTCSLGSADLNERLSQKRAEAVKEYLISHFKLSPEQIKAVGFGMKRPKYSNATEEGKRKNRRVTAVNTLRPYVMAEDKLFLKIEAKYLRDGQVRVIQPEETLTSRDNYSISFVADRSCFVYLFQLDPYDTLTQLFPNPAFSKESNPVRPGQLYRVPEEITDWLFLDESTGEEALILLASREPLSDPRAVCRNLQANEDTPEPATQSAVESTYTRGPQGIRRLPADVPFVWRRDFKHLQ